MKNDSFEKIIMKIFFYIVLTFMLFFHEGCNSTNKVVVSTKTDNGFLVEILTESSWEYSKSTYYRISKNGELLINSTFIEPVDEAYNVKIKIVDNLFFGIEPQRPNIVLFIHRSNDNASWPNDRKWAFELLSDLRIKTHISELELSSHVEQM